MTEKDLILYSTEDGQSQFVLRQLGGQVWLSQLEIAELYQSSKQNISKHIKSVLADGELVEAAVVNSKLTTAFMRGYRFYIDHSVNIYHTTHNITATLSALSSLIKGVSRNLGGFSLPEIYPSERNGVGK